MNIIKNIKRNAAIDRMNEERLYEYVVNEIKGGSRREGLWGQALEKANGNTKKTESIYIKLRVQSLKDENEINSLLREQQKQDDNLEKQKIVKKQRLKDDEIKSQEFKESVKVWKEQNKFEESDSKTSKSKRNNYAIISILSLIASLMGFYIGYETNNVFNVPTIILLGLSGYFYICYLSQKN